MHPIYHTSLVFPLNPYRTYVESAQAEEHLTRMITFKMVLTADLRKRFAYPVEDSDDERDSSTALDEEGSISKKGELLY